MTSDATAAWQRFEIVEALHAVEICVDQRDLDGFASYFSAHARYEGSFGTYEGRTAIREMSRLHHESGSMLGKRRMTGPMRVSVNGKSARADSHWWVAEAHDTPGVYSTGTYHDTLRRSRDRWLIIERKMTIDPSWKGQVIAATTRSPTSDGGP
jgi:hypothetical protein